MEWRPYPVTVSPLEGSDPNRLSLLVLSGVLLWSMPAESQTATTLSSDTGQTSTGTSVIAVGSTAKRAQGFTTDPNPNGYRPSHAGLGWRYRTPRGQVPPAKRCLRGAYGRRRWRLVPLSLPRRRPITPLWIGLDHCPAQR